MLRSSLRPLSDHAPYLTAANVRSRFDPAGLLVGDGIGAAGDLVLGEVVPLDEPVVVIDQGLGVHHVDSPTRVLAPLGTRESATHLNGGIPDGGLDVHAGRAAHWIAGESGLVGLLWAEGRPTKALAIETSVPFRCIGLVKDGEGRNVNVADFALPLGADRFDRPLICVGATSAEAGKTVLTRKVIAATVARGLRTGSVKVSGTGGTLDPSQHRRAGAHIVLDQVDAGLVTTYCDSASFRERIVRPFRYARDAGAAVVVAELGGDLVYANNPTFLTMPEMVDNIRMLMVVNNDPLSCLGIVRFLDEALAFPMDRVRLFASPFRSYAGQVKRMPALGLRDLWDPNDEAHVDALVTEALGPVR